MTKFRCRTAALAGFIAGAALVAGAACSKAQPASETASEPPKTADDNYKPPPEGTPIVQSLTAHRESNGQVKVTGKILLPATTRVWVEMYPASPAPTSNPQEQLLGRSELYLDPGGTFEAGPFKLTGAGPFRVLVTSYFSRAWQPPEVLRVVGIKGTRLPKSALKLDNPQSPEGGGHLEYSGSLTVG
jgi:hypothetical protein